MGRGESDNQAKDYADAYDHRDDPRILPVGPVPRVEPLGYAVRMRCDDMPWNYQGTLYLHPHEIADAEEDAEALRHGPGDGWLVEVLPLYPEPAGRAPENIESDKVEVGQEVVAIGTIIGMGPLRDGMRWVRVSFGSECGRSLVFAAWRAPESEEGGDE